MLLAGCASSPAGPPPEREYNATGDIIPYKDLVVRHKFSWKSGKHEVVDDTHIRISYTGGPPLECERTGAKVVERPESVTITLLYGEIPNAKKICKDESKIYQMSSGENSIMVETKTPIGNRKIIDGAAKK